MEWGRRAEGSCYTPGFQLSESRRLYGAGKCFYSNG